MEEQIGKIIRQRQAAGRQGTGSKSWETDSLSVIYDWHLSVIYDWHLSLIYDWHLPVVYDLHLSVIFVFHLTSWYLVIGICKKYMIGIYQ
jgi:hypothetical protein